MVAVNPQRVHPYFFRDAHLDQIISIICQKNDQLLQVVNYNVEHYQYVVAGENGNLNILGMVIDEIHQMLKKHGKEAKIDRASVEQLVEAAMKETEENVRDPLTRRIVLKRGVATIPLPGIDVPFHSRFLKDGVPAFRQILLQRMTSQQLNPSILVGRYIPNVTAVPFSLDRAYVQVLCDETQSPVLEEVLNKFDDYRRTPQQLAFNILVELLAYQFASPVRWIETQKVIFAKFGVERLIEVGPAPTLSQMAKTTLALGNYSPLIKHENLWYNRDRDVIYYNREDPPADAAAIVTPPPVESVAPSAPKSGVAPPPATTPTPITAPTPTPSLPTPPASSAPVVDEKPTALESLLTLLSIKLQKDVDTIPATASVKSLTGGKSALQNEIIGDVQKEFEKEPEGAAEMEVSTLASKLADGPDGKHKLGSFLNGQISKLISGKMPGGFPLSSLKGYLAGRYALGEGRIEGVLLRGLAGEPKARLGTEDEAKKWLDGVVADYARAKGVALFDSAGSAGSDGAGAGTRVIDSALLDKLEERGKAMVRDQMKAFYKYLSENPLDKETKVKLFEQLLKEKAEELSLWYGPHPN
jgi:malonyl CoA-acyl carrier protein transacylase